jgi:hypothetical protein
MITLRVVMGRRWLKEAVNKISTALIYGPGMPDNSSDVSIEKRMNKAGVASHALRELGWHETLAHRLYLYM